MTNTRLLLPDFLRGIAALGVVAFHASAEGAQSLFLLVDLFFVLSGLVLSRSFLALQTRKSVFRFIEKRLWRFLPLVWVALLVKLFIEIGERCIGDNPQAVSSFLNYLGAALLLQVILTGSLLIVIPLWSLSVELLVNALFGILGFRLLKVLGAIVVLGYCLIGLGFWVDGAFIEDLGPIRGLEGMGRGLVGIALGVLIAQVKAPSKYRLHAALGLVASIAFLIQPANPLMVFLAGPVFAYLVWALLPTSDSTNSTLFQRLSLGLGRLSFGIYIWHAVLMGPVHKALSYLPIPEVFQNWSFALVSMVVSAVAAAVSFRFVETPTMNIIKNKQI
jgi:peptidoglycan/LPS O-acetylase OafA/YrhL